MELRRVKVKDVHPYERNPRRNDKAAEEVKKSIEACGYANPIVCDETMTILAGHTRWKALKLLGWETCDVIIRDGLTDDQKRKFRLYDNRAGELSEWDFDLLERELASLDFSGFDINWDLPIEDDSFGTTEFKNTEFSEDSFSDEEFTYLCPCCGFRFNK